jgi:excinuclease ABC subunit C
MKLLEQTEKMPKGSGVYVFLNKKNKPLYVGRATSLKRRVLSYFQGTQDPRIAEMVSRAASIKYHKTDNLLEAIILEANFIKKYWPKYNVKEKDNRSFIYIVFLKTEWPKPFIVRQRELQKFSSDVNVFGPYQSLSLVKNALRIIRKVFPYSTCKIDSGKPCFDYQIGLCPGVCVGAISKQDYQKNIDNLILFLRGEKKKLLKKLEKENPAAIQSLKHIQDVALISREEILEGGRMNKIEGYDISHLAGKEIYGSMVVFTGGALDKAKYRLFKIKKAPPNDDLRALEEVIIRRFRHPEWRYPDLILVDGGKPQVDYIGRVLKRLNIVIPLVGISKFAGDKLVFPAKMKPSLKELIQAMKITLLKVREESHRFALKSSRRKRIL